MRQRAYASSDYSAFGSDVFWVAGNRRAQTGEFRLDIDSDGMVRTYMLVRCSEALPFGAAVRPSDPGSGSDIYVQATNTGTPSIGIAAHSDFATKASTAIGDYLWVLMEGNIVAKVASASRGTFLAPAAAGFLVEAVTASHNITGFTMEPTSGEYGAGFGRMHSIPGVGRKQ